MKLTLRFLAVLAAALCLLALCAWLLVRATTREWFERDIASSAELVVSGSRRALLADLRSGDVAGLRELLGDIAGGERIVAAALCNERMQQVASTQGFPPGLDCAGIAARRGERPAAADARVWREVTKLDGTRVEVTANQLLDEDTLRGFVLLVHDLGFAERRQRSAQLFMLAALVVLVALAALLTLVAVRVLWRNWSRALVQLAQGETSARRPEFVPLLKDLRELIERLAEEENTEMQAGMWTPQRLKLTLHRHLQGERLIVLANREPYIHERDADGGVRVMHPASGLVSALEPVLRACSGVWIAHGSGSADREHVDARDHVGVPPEDPTYVLRRLWLSTEQVKGYYYGFANEGLWPLCHVVHARPVFRADDWKQYQEVNRRFVDAVIEESDTDDPVVLVQDYHLALVPRMLRERLPRATIISFWHIPWPNAEQISICPWHVDLVDGLLGSSILGFHTQFHCNNFLEAADRFLEARIDREDFAVVRGQNRTLVRSYPISVEWPHRWADAAPPVEQCRAEALADLGLAADAKLGVGVDRLDYTKGIEERFHAIERLLEREPQWLGRMSFLQIASPSRTEIERYARLHGDVTELAARINARFGTDAWQPIVLRRTHLQPPDVFRLFRAADFCYVSSLHDGMNLVAKEYLAARSDEQGVLVLSKFTGAARELAEALIVNPYDTDEAASAIAAALVMPPEEQRMRMRAMRRLIAELNVYRWAGRMLLDAARLRRREQLVGVLGNGNLHVAQPTRPVRAA
jgi:trehalose 6-phosphate synthase